VNPMPRDTSYFALRAEIEDVLSTEVDLLDERRFTDWLDYLADDIVYFANTRGADKIMYAGYYPAVLSLDRIFAEMPDVGFRDHVWPKFLRENALRLFGLGDESAG